MMALFLLVAQEAGLAAKHPGDEGIERDPRVLFAENFETGKVGNLGGRWSRVYLPENMDFAEDVPEGSIGRRSLHISKNGHLYWWRPKGGVDQMFARFYVKFHPKTGFIHHFVNIVADAESDGGPSGWAAIVPRGDQRFTTGIEPFPMGGPAPGAWHFYTYWHEMKSTYGTFFDPPRPSRIQPGRWSCVEAMVKCNTTPQASDGEQALWVDGQQVAHFKGIRWRSSDKLKINCFWLLYYVTEQAARLNSNAEAVYEVWFDDIILATEYVGPVKRKSRGGEGGMLFPSLAKPGAGKLVYSENFEKGIGRFEDGEAADGGANGSKAMAVSPAVGATLAGAFSTVFKESTRIRFKAKPLAEVEQVSVYVWSDTLQENGRSHVRGLKKGEWREVEIKAADLRGPGAKTGMSLLGSPFDNLRVVFEGGEGDKVLVDDLEIRE